MKKISFTLLAFIAIFSATAQKLSTFEDLGLPADTFWNGSNQSGGFNDGGAYFTNSYDTAYGGFWSSGFAYSNVPVNVDTITTGTNDDQYEYSAAPGSGAFASRTFGICNAYGPTTLNLTGSAMGHQVYGFYVSNSAYDYASMKYGDAFAKKFGGTTGTDPDWFRLTVSGWYQGNPVANTDTIYLADFRSPNMADHYILKTWEFVSLLSLGNVDSLSFSLSSDDTAGGFGMNTPAFFVLDNLLTNPVLEADSFTLTYMDTLTGNADTLIGNIVSTDTFNAIGPLSLSLASTPLIIGASAYLNANDSLVYIPAAGIQGADTLLYSLCGNVLDGDTVRICDTAQIIIRVLGPNDTGVPDIGLPDLSMYPNPASSIVTVTYSSAIESVSVVDMTGRTVEKSDTRGLGTSLDIGGLNPGVYTVLVHTADGTAVRRLVKE